MSRLKLQVDTDVFELREVIRESGIEEGSEIGQIDVHFPEGCFIQTPAIALLTSWLLSKKSEGHTISLEGSQRAIGYLARMNFHRSLELEEPDHSELPESGRFIPLMLVEDGESVFKAVNLIADTVLQQFDTASDFLPALEWAVNEIVDNVLIHSQTQSPGVVCAQLFENKERLKIAICDSGIGIYESLKGSYSIDDDDSAIEKALERGVTRDLKIGQGNGLAGSLEILSQNRGEFSLWSGKTIFHSNQDGERRFFKGHGIPGTGVSMSFNLSEPVSLGNTWIGERDYSYIDAEADRISEEGIVIKDVCSHTGSRPPATRLRRKILTILPEIEGSISLDFSGIKSFSSSFLDELLGRLNSELGVQKFNEKIVIKGLEDLHMNMANNVIGQRLESESGETNRTNAWLTRLGIGNPKSEDPKIKIIFDGEPELFQAIKEGDWILTIDENTEVVSVAEVLRKKQTLENTTLFFKKAECVSGSEKQVELEERCKTEGSIERIQWEISKGSS